MSLCLCGFLLGCRSVPHLILKTPEGTQSFADAGVAKAEGDRLWQIDPRTLDSAARSLECFRCVVAAAPDDYEACWKAARAAGWVSERERVIETRKRTAIEGISLGDAAVLARPDGAEGHYYRALAMGALADVDHSYGLSAVRQMERDCLAAVASDERIDFGGAHLLLGILYQECPGPPVSIGSLRKSKKSLGRVLELFPDWPPNHLWAGRLARKQQDADGARKEFQRVVDAPVPSGWATEANEWQKDARDDLAK